MASRRIQSDGIISINPELGESGDIFLKVTPRENAVFQVERQYETSLTTMNEGPHFDLLDWKHFVSEWEVAKEIEEGCFALTTPQSDEFPNVTTEEIVAAVSGVVEEWQADGAGNGRWTGLAKRCATPQSYPCGVGVSTVRARIRVKSKGGWQTIQQIRILVPMGC